ncbi:MAG: DUF4340 domain-containing protein [Planctomycetota bacterium]
MNRLTTLVLFVVVAALGYVAYQQTEREAENPLVQKGPLFPGVELRRVKSVRLENIRGSRHMRFERDASGRWFLTDPMQWPAEQGLMKKLEQVLERNQATPIPDALVADAEPSFDPPRGFLETEEVLESGETRRVRVELGKKDLDGARVYVRRDGKIYRTLRNAETLFNFAVTDFRSKNVFTMPPAGVVAVERVGGWYEEEAQESLGMRAAREGYGWRIESPARLQGDPVLFTLWVRFLSGMRAKRFTSDRPDMDLARFGLDQPWVTITLTNARGASQSVHFASFDGRIYARRAEEPTVYEIDVDDGQRIREPVTHFYDGAFARFDRVDLRHVFVRRGAGSLRLTKTGEDWTVAASSPTRAEYDAELPADDRAVEALLTAIEGAEVVRYFQDAPPADFFDEGAARDDGLWVQTTEGLVQGAAFAAPVRTPQGTELAPILRDQDSVVGSVDPAFAEIAGLDLVHFLDRNLWSLSNAALRVLTIEKDGAKRVFQRAAEYDWRPIDAKVPARELDVVLDHLLFLKAREHLAEGDRPALEDVVTVTFVDGRGERSVARIGRTDEGAVQVDVGAMRAVLRRPELHADLLEIVSRRPERAGAGG